MKLIHSQTSTVQKTNMKDVPGVVNQKLKLVVSNPVPFSSQELTIRNSIASSCFTMSLHSRGPNLYEMIINDSAYRLKCNLILEVEEALDEFESGTVICHFSKIADEQLNDFVEEDETLFGIIMIEFQMKILEQLMMFCATHYALELVIFVDDAQADELGIYQDFLTSEDQTLTSKGEKTEMIIPTDQETFDAWIDFMEEVTVKFHQTLWREQRNNPIIRQYLENRAVLAI